ncbi:MAG: GntR family transcriptional regulator [Parvularcula sp.]|nr:GntR family transcriptional regulator [Parvularcula sp.]
MPSEINQAGTETVQQRVYFSLSEDILAGRIEPGQSLTIRGIAEKLSVSSTPVREALRRLVAERALEMMDNRRVRIPEMTIERFDDLLSTRILLETEAAERSLPYLDETKIAELEVLDADVAHWSETGDYDRWIKANFKFHETLYGARPDSTLVPLIRSIWLQIGPFLRQALKSIEDHYSVDRHAEALRAMKERHRLGLRIAIEADIRDGISHIGNQFIRNNAQDNGRKSKRKKKSNQFVDGQSH